MTAVSLYRPWCKCPNERCGRPVALRITEQERNEAAAEPPQLIKATTTCHRVGCREILVLTARHYSEAVFVGVMTIHGGRIVGTGTAKGGKNADAVR